MGPCLTGLWWGRALLGILQWPHALWGPYPNRVTASARYAHAERPVGSDEEVALKLLEKVIRIQSIVVG